jgi:pyruvate ferredoxin oxidoreductase gamma subunit
MIEIAIYGRGGQGVVKAAQLLAVAAFFSGYEAQAFPMFGVERRGAPVQAFVRIDKEPIRTRAQVRKGDYALVLDSTLTKSIKISGKNIMINSSKKAKSRRNFDADAIATKIFPQAANTAMISAFAFFTGIITKDALVKACNEIFDVEAVQKNIQVIKGVYSAL